MKKKTQGNPVKIETVPGWVKIFDTWYPSSSIIRVTENEKTETTPHNLEVFMGTRSFTLRGENIIKLKEWMAS